MPAASSAKLQRKTFFLQFRIHNKSAQHFPHPTALCFLLFLECRKPNLITGLKTQYYSRAGRMSRNHYRGSCSPSTACSPHFSYFAAAHEFVVRTLIIYSKKFITILLLYSAPSADSLNALFLSLSLFLYVYIYVHVYIRKYVNIY